MNVHQKLKSHGVIHRRNTQNLQQISLSILFSAVEDKDGVVMYNCLSAKLVRLFAQPNVDLVNKRVVCSIVGWARASVEEVLVCFFASWYLSALPLPLLLCSPYHYYHGLIVMVIIYCRGRSVE